MLHPVKLVRQFRMLGTVTLNLAEPVIAQRLAAAADAVAEAVVNPVRHKELRILGPMVIVLGQPDFVLAQGLAVRGAGVLLVRAHPSRYGCRR